MGCLALNILEQNYRSREQKMFVVKNSLTLNKSENKVRSAYAFGMIMPGRTFSSANYRYGFNGHEKDDEVKGDNNHLSFGDYGYDPQTGRRWNVEPFIKKYPSHSSYLVFANNPILFTDPDGKDIIILSAPEGANGAGHAAVLIGNDKSGWTLYSKNGTYSSAGTSGPSDKHPQNGVYFKSLKDFSENENLKENGTVEYTSAFRIVTSVEIDEKMAEAASEQVSSVYSLVGASCIDVCSDALKAGGLNQGVDNIPGTDIEGAAKSLTPNQRFEKIVENNNGTDVTNQILPSQAKIDEKKKKFKESISIKIKALKEAFNNAGNKEGDAVPKDNTYVAPK